MDQSHSNSSKTGHTSVVLEEGFKFDSYTKFFGFDALAAKRYKYYGILPQGATIDEGELVVYEKAVFNESLAFSSIAPAFAGTAFDELKLNNVVISYQNFKLNCRRIQGWHIDLDIIFDETYGQLHDVLADFLHQKNPTLHLHASLGRYQEWENPLHLSGFTLEGSVSDLRAFLCDEVSLTSFGVQLSGIHSTTYLSNGLCKIGKEYGFGVFGTMDIKLPEWSKPVELDFWIGEMAGQLDFSACIKYDWQDAFGFKGLVFEEFSIFAALQIKSPLNMLSFGAKALLRLGEATAEVFGSFSMTGAYSLSVSLRDVGWAEIYAIYQQLIGGTLEEPDFEFNIGLAEMTISNGQVSLAISELVVGEYLAFDGSASFSKTEGVTLSAFVEGREHLKLGKFSISEAAVKITIPCSGTDKQADVILGGKFLYNKTFSFDVGAHIYEAEEPGGEGLQVTVYGKCSADKSAPCTLSSLVPQLKGCTMLENVTFELLEITYATQEDAELGALVHLAYPIQKGLYIRAVLGEIAGINKLANTSEPLFALFIGYTGSGWNDGGELKLGMACLKKDLELPIGHGIKADSISLEIRLGQLPSLYLKGGLEIPIKDQKPLHFTLDCRLEADSSLTLGGLLSDVYWDNPFNLCRDLRLGPELGLSVTVLLSTVTPTAFGIKGQFQFKKIRVKLDMKIGARPSDQFLELFMANVDLKDLSEVAKALTKIDLGVNANVVFFNNLYLYICPVGTAEHERGFTFNADMTICGKSAVVKAKIGSDSVFLDAVVDSFNIGDYTISGVNGGASKLVMNLSSSTQQGNIDAKLSGPDINAVMVGTFQLKPDISFKFKADLRFTEELYFTIAASSQGGLGNDDADLSNVDYFVEAKFHSHPAIMQHIHSEIRRLFRENAASLSFIDDGPLGPITKAVVPLSQILNSLNINEVFLKATIGKSSGKFNFNANIKGTVFDPPLPFDFSVNFALHALTFLKAIFDEICTIVKNELLDLTKIISNIPPLPQIPFNPLPGLSPPRLPPIDDPIPSVPISGPGVPVRSIPISGDPNAPVRSIPISDPNAPVRSIPISDSSAPVCSIPISDPSAPVRSVPILE